MIQLLPTASGVPDYAIRLRLDGRDFNFRFLWNMRAERWSFDIRDVSDVPLLMGVRIVANRSLLRFYQWDPRLPPGEMIALDASNLSAAEPPGLYDFGIGKRVELTYQPKTSF